MDPTTTLITFMLQTSFPTQSIHLVGSWDNFSKRYPMERDTRRAHGQWRGCYQFKGITCDGTGQKSPTRDGGLKMGQTYWYYYESDDGTEMHDSSVPSTTTCPLLPGQPVNLLQVPVEVNPMRTRSASTSSVNGDVKTMNPEDKFLTPRPPPARPEVPTRVMTSPSLLETTNPRSSSGSDRSLPSTRSNSARSISPAKRKQRWIPRTMFGLKPSSREASRPSSPESIERGRPIIPAPPTAPIAALPKNIDACLANSASPEKFHRRNFTVDSKSPTRIPSPSLPSPPLASPSVISQSLKIITNTRDIPPLRVPVAAPAPLPSIQTAMLSVPDEVVEDDEEDDDFAPFSPLSPTTGKEVFTRLAPPPLSRKVTPPLVLSPPPLSRKVTPPPMLSRNLSHPPRKDSAFPLPPQPKLDSFSIPTSISSTPDLSSPTEDSGIDSSNAYDSHDDDSCDPLSPIAEESSPPRMAPYPKFQNYSLPDHEFSSARALLKANTAAPEITGIKRSESSDSPARMTFGPVMADAPVTPQVSALEEFMIDLGYLGGAIVRAN